MAGDWVTVALYGILLILGFLRVTNFRPISTALANPQNLVELISRCAWDWDIVSEPFLAGVCYLQHSFEFEVSYG